MKAKANATSRPTRLGKKFRSEHVSRYMPQWRAVLQGVVVSAACRLAKLFMPVWILTCQFGANTAHKT